MHGSLRAGPGRVDRAGLAVDQETPDAVFLEGGGVRRAENALEIGVVVGEEHVFGWLGQQHGFPQRMVLAEHADAHLLTGVERQARARVRIAEGPGVAIPERRQQVQRRGVGAVVGRADFDQHILGTFLGVFDEHVEIAVFVEDPGVEQFVLQSVFAPAVVFRDQIFVGKSSLRVFVETFEVGMGGRGIEVKVIFLHVLTVVALGAREAEHALLEDGIFFVPERQGEAEPLVVVGDAQDAVLAPAVGAGAGVVVRKVIPRLAGRAVILAHGSPLAFAQVRPPLAPIRLPQTLLFQPLLLRIHDVGNVQNTARESMTGKIIPKGSPGGSAKPVQPERPGHAYLEDNLSPKISPS